MPKTTMATSRLFALAGRELTEEELKETLFRTKVELGSFHDGEVDVEVNPDRLDLLDEGGLAWEIQGALGTGHGLPGHASSEPRPGVEARVNASVGPLRPHLALAVAVAPEGKSLDAGWLDELVRFQESLHATLGRDRASASLGLYPLQRLRPPFHYALEPLGQVRFRPLGGEAEVEASTFYEQHPMARKYGALGRHDDLVLTLRDDQRTVLSLPPVLNAAGAGEVAAGDREVLIEATGTRASRTREMVGHMLVPFVARGWSVHPVPVHSPAGTDDGRSVVGERTLPVTLGSITSLLGTRLSASDVEKGLLACRLGVQRTGNLLEARVPPWRPDLLSAVDLAEEVAIARGYASFAPILPPSLSMGRRLPQRLFRRQLSEVLLGMGYQELHTQVLLSPGAVARVAPAGEAVALKNPISTELSVLRPLLRASLLDVLGRNTRSGYPQRVFEVADVVVRDPTAETGTRSEVHLAVAEAAEDAGFAGIAAVAERLFTVLGFPAPREPAEAPGTIAGRVAKLRIAGETVALLGEVHPSVLVELKLPVPAAWLEVDLTRLERLKGLSAS